MCCFSFTMIRFFSHISNTFDKHLFTGISMVICKIGWSIRSWLSDYISFSFYKSYCRHDIYWILVAFMIAASALIKVSRLYGLYRQLYTQLIYWHCAVILYTHVNLLNKRFWILNQWSITMGIHRSLVDFPHRGPVRREAFPCDDVINLFCRRSWQQGIWRHTAIWNHPGEIFRG